MKAVLARGLVAGAMLLPVLCQADRLQIPLTLDHYFIESLLQEQVFTGTGGTIRLNDDGTGCQYLVLRNPRITTSAGDVLLRTDAEARAGRAVGDRCLLILDWRGGLEFTQEPIVGDDRSSVLLRNSGWRALRPDGTTDTVSTTVGRWIEQFLPVGLKETRISLTEPLDELQAFLGLMVPPSDAAGPGALLDSLAIDSVTAEDDHATVTLGIDVPPSAPPSSQAEPTLTDEELARLAPRFDAVDAFFTYTVKSVADAPGGEHAAALLEVLVELRRDLVTILGERQRASDDPARALFVHAWERLAPILRAIAEQQPDHTRALQYLTFIGAGDALLVLDEVGPAAGIEVSSEGLRRLARILIPGDPRDPLEHDDAVDPELRRSLGFGEPLPAPRNYDATSWLDWLIPSAVAAESLDSSVVERLNNWVPKTRDMKVYLPMVRDVLRHVITGQLRGNGLEPAFHDVYRWMVLAVAWQESCWRQFVAKNDKRVPVESGTGDVGMMQINPKVWRGFYDLHGLRWDIVYNARAGADILEHHMIHYALRHNEHQTTGVMDNLARSTYAAYNGGPSQYARYRAANPSDHGRKVDTLFYDKYREVKSGKELAVSACYAG